MSWTRTAFFLVAGTMVYNVVEALVALYAAWRAGSIALLGFGIDSVIEVAAGALLLWRIRVGFEVPHSEEAERVEKRARQGVGITFLALGLYVSAQASMNLWGRSEPEESLLGIALAILSLVVMPVISFWKFRAAREIGSPALRAEAKETLACSYLSLTLLVGLLANALAGWWWADSTAALLMVPWLVKEGIEGLRGEECRCGES
jgi:divalent metal cation (Fe/Co/Zn/Cd) transporter